MPCVCLSNTFRRWQIFRTWKAELRKQKLAQQHATLEQKKAQKLAVKQRQAGQKQAHRAEKLAGKLARKQKRLQRQWQQKAEPTLIKPASKQPPVVIEPKLKAAPRITEEVLRIPHPRKPLTSAASVSQTLTAAISRRMLTPQPAPQTAATKFVPVLRSRRLPTNVMNLQPIRAQDIRPGASRSDLINAESRLGSRIFGPIPYGHRREFFHDRKNIWIWHEDWRDESQKLHEMTVRYEVRTSGIYKKISTGKYLRLEGAELDNFCQATKMYLYLIKKYLYKMPIPAAI